MVVFGKINNGVLDVMSAIYNECGKVYKINSFNNSGICPECFKKSKEDLK